MTPGAFIGMAGTGKSSLNPNAPVFIPTLGRSVSAVRPEEKLRTADLVDIWHVNHQGTGLRLVDLPCEVSFLNTQG
jgi:hypothetical protein